MRRLFGFSLLLLLACEWLAMAAEDKTVFLAILARNKAHVLPSYLTCIDNLNYNKKAITVYINTNNNEDETLKILEKWAKKNKNRYNKILFEAHQVGGLGTTKPHEWTVQRFKVLGDIRNRSLRMAKIHNCQYYFVVDCDNFINPCTLRELIKKNKPIIAPMLRAIPFPDDPYSNFVCDIGSGGYEKDHPDYLKILHREKVGTFPVPIVHCTYLVDMRLVDKLSYTDQTKHHEFIIFSRSARRNGIEQYICNEKEFGTLLHYGRAVTLAEEQQRVAKLGSLVPAAGNCR
jgi:glycosyltransferase involved in cell wall biosynthesis